LNRHTTGRAGQRISLVIGWLLMPLLLGACSLTGTNSTATVAPTASVVGVVATGTATIGGTRPGGGTPTLPPTPPTSTALPPTPATPATPTRGSAATPGPLGSYPADWRIYQGRLPFAIAYPPNWTVDESQLGNNLVYFYAPGPEKDVFVVIATTAKPEENANLDVLRDRWFQSRTRGCSRFAIDQSGQEVQSGLTFATVGATCDLPTGLAYSYTGLGVRGTVPWIFEFNAPYDRYAAMLVAIFRPMIATLNIYGRVDNP